MFCSKCEVKMRLHELEGNRLLHSCPRCGRTEITDTLDPDHLSNQVYDPGLPPPLHFDTDSIPQSMRAA